MRVFFPPENLSFLEFTYPGAATIFTRHQSQTITYLPSEKKKNPSKHRALTLCLDCLKTPNPYSFTPSSHQHEVINRIFLHFPDGETGADRVSDSTPGHTSPKWEAGIPPDYLALESALLLPLC